MQIRVSDLQPEGTIVSETLSLESINERMNLSPQNEILFLKEPEVTVKVRSAPGGAEVVGIVKSLYQQPCGVCVEPLELPLEVDLHFTLKPAETQEPASDEEALQDDVGILTYQGEHIDLEEVVQEALILKIDPYYSPPRKKDGTCTSCGKCPKESFQVLEDAPESATTDTVSFGDLLEAAKKKKKK